jgi:hypothetical protein
MAIRKMTRFSGAMPAGVESEFDRNFRILLSTVMHECRLSRPEIAEQLSLKVGRIENPITESILSDYCTTTRTGARFPAAYIPAFCEVVGDDRPRQFLLGSLSRTLLDLGKQALSSECEKNRLIRAAIDAGARKEGR